MTAATDDSAAARWRALPWRGPPPDPNDLSPRAIDPSWQSLGQSWRADGLEPGFQPGWARITWAEDGLWCDAVFTGPPPRNRARQLNENAWELGDVGEFFVQAAGATDYLEIHVTPENQRLQLLWLEDTLQRVRAGTLRRDELKVARPDWVQSRTRVGPDFWVAQVFVPADRLGFARLTAGQLFRAAVCRYDYTPAPAFVLSSTAPLRERSFHRRHEWHTLVLG